MPSSNAEKIRFQKRLSRVDAIAQKDALIAELRRENRRLSRELQRMNVYRTMAYRDGLTGLHNRRFFDERLREEGARAERFRDYSFGFIMLDLDHFKEINDTYGHPMGDRVLCALANKLSELVRDVDICCRIGGDEFGVLLPATDDAGCRLVSERLEGLVLEVDGLPAPVGVSVGLATHPSGLSSVHDLFQQADEAMYRHKGRNSM